MFHSTRGRSLRRPLLPMGALAAVLGLAAVLSQPAAAVTTDNEKFVNQIYRDLLLRQAKPAEIAAYAKALDKGQTRAWVVNRVERLTAHRNQQVRRLFAHILGRAPSDVEQHLYGNELIAARTVEHVAAEILALDEFYFGPGGGTDRGFVDAVFLYATGAVPDSETQAYYLGLLDTNSRQRVARIILNTDAAYAYFSTSWYNKLCREPISAMELSVCVTMFQAGEREEAVIADMMATEEYFQYAITHN